MAGFWGELDNWDTERSFSGRFEVDAVFACPARGFVGFRASSLGADLGCGVGFCVRGCEGFFRASARVFRVVLATSVANMYLSRGAKVIVGFCLLVVVAA